MINIFIFPSGSLRNKSFIMFDFDAYLEIRDLLGRSHIFSRQGLNFCSNIIDALQDDAMVSSFKKEKDSEQNIVFFFE